jgi:type IV pilus assembly protein PilY1
MKRFERHLTLTLALLFLCAAPFVTDGQVNNAACCNLASSFTSSIFQGGNGDEDFFSVPGGPPNVMFLLDNSLSMLDMPNALPTVASGTGTCTGTYLDNYVALRSSIPYDNGYTTSLLTDNPPWGTGRCSGSTCLFVATSYYRYRSMSWDWTVSSATPRTSADACNGAVPNVGACQTCLDSQGYYVWNSGGGSQAAFKGDFLNGYPPKFIAARKVIKDIISIDDAHPSPLDDVRFGLTIFNPNSSACSGIGSSLANCDGGQLVVPLGPNCDAYPMTNALEQAPRQAVIDAINNTTLVPFSSYTPLAETLFNIGQYFTAGGNPQLYDTLFGNGWRNNGFAENASGEINASWTGGNKNQKSICWACQQSSVVIVTDGQPTVDNNLPKPGIAAHTGFGAPPNDDFRSWSNGTIDCPACGTDGVNGSANLLHKVAYFLHQTDLRTDYTGTQNVVTYTVSFGLDPVADATAMALLQKTADLGQGTGVGGGIFANASNGSDLNQALFNAITDVVSRATSFSNANTSTLQTAGRNQIFLTRFRPHSDPAWEGHVYRFNLFYEFAMGCDSTKTNAQQTMVTCGTKTLNPNLNGDTDASGKAICDGLFKLDQDCDPVTEDLNGNFVKATFDPTTHLLVASATPANPFWDAGQVLSDPTRTGYRNADENAANKRVIWTVTDSNGDGQFTSADGLTEFTAANAATLAPLMQLDPTWCLNLLQRASLCGIGSAPACPTVSGWTAANTAACAKQVIYYIRGWDVLDQDGDNCAGPGNPNNTGCPAGQDGEQRDRANDDRLDPTFWKLGDVFHSSPVVVEPPVDEFTCDLGLDNQCVATLHGPQALTLAVQTPMDCTAATCDVNGNGTLDPGEDAYSMYRKNNLGRQQVLLVGANDGMLHAFDAGVPASGTVGPFGYTYTAGTGAELWAFIPPDLLPKLKNALDNHDYFVDGDVMVRDVWVDANKDGKKQPSEFHTVAVMSERSGGSVYTALDVTNPNSPQFRWAFPKLCTAEVNMVGQSWTGFAPRPPPIGPVEIALPYTNGPADPLTRGFEERWVVALNGGYDPSLTRGKGVWIADVWTGDVLWGFTNDTFQTNINATGSMWPVAASPALVDLGKSGDASAQFDGFFDTLTWTDIGGQMFVARLDPPGQIDPVSGRVTNWTGTRFFEEQRQVDGSQPSAGRSEFYFMPANAVDGATKYLHTYVGSGNREHILQVGAACGPDNLLACCQSGCNVVDVTSHFNYAGSTNCDFTQHWKCQSGTLRQDMSAISGTCTSFQCGGLNANVQLHLNCGSAGNPPDVIAHLQCDANGNCCQTIGNGTCVKVTKGKSLNPAKLTPPTNHSRFYGIWSYGGPRVFGTTSNYATTLTQAQTFDQNRFTDIAFAGSCTGTAGSSCTAIQTTQAAVNGFGGVTCGGGVTNCSATSYDAGWFYEYGDVCPLASCNPAPPWLDEKTGAAADVIAGCTVWNTFRPLGSGISLAAPCTNQSGVPQNYNYVANAVTGVPDTRCGYSGTSAIYRASYRQAIAPPLAPTMLLGISGGNVQAAAGQPGDPGAPPPGGDKAKAMGGTRSLSQQGYWLEVPRDLHQCRHADATQCN